MYKIYNFIAFLLFLFVTGCAHGNALDFNDIEEHFVYIEEEINISICHKDFEDVCIPADKGVGKASGVLIAHSKERNKSYFLTAGHVCIDQSPKSNEKFNIKIDQEFHLYNGKGDNIVATVVAIDEEHDLCILESKRVPYMPAIIARKQPARHSVVYNVAAPAGIWSKNTMLHFVGEFQGNYKGAHDEMEEEWAMYTIAIQKGSSGSPVYDPETGRLIGILTMAVPPSYEIAFGPTLEQINQFVDENLPS